MHTGLTIKSVRVSTKPKTGNLKKHLKKPSLSKNSAQLLVALAKNTEDPELKRALSTLAEHLSSK